MKEMIFPEGISEEEKEEFYKLAQKASLYDDYLNTTDLAITKMKDCRSQKDVEELSELRDKVVGIEKSLEDE